MFINNIHRGDRVVFVDDVISTGGTLLSIAQALRKIGAEITDILIVFEKTREKARMRSEEHTSELQSHSELVCRLLPEKKEVSTPKNMPSPHTDEASATCSS